MKLKFIATAGLVFVSYSIGYGQLLTLEDALYRTQNQYDKIKVKQQLVDASAQNTAFKSNNIYPILRFLHSKVSEPSMCSMARCTLMAD